jgi:hypothetical protein
MSIYTTPISQLTTSDLQSLLEENAVENTRLEFKLLPPTKDEMLKKLSSFANTFGGILVVGAKASSTDGRLEDLPGIDAEAGYKQKIVQWAFDGANPPIAVEVSDPIPMAAQDRKVCYVIRVEESEAAPHFLNGRKGVWIRTDEYSARAIPQLANEAEFGHLFSRRAAVRDRRDKVISRARKRFRSYSDSLLLNRGLGSTHEQPPSLSFCVVPRFPLKPLCDQERLRNLIASNAIAWRQTRFPKVGSIISQHESLIIPNPVRLTSFCEINVWGLLHYVVEVLGSESGTDGIHLYGFIGNLLVFIRHSSKVLSSLDYSGSLHIEIKLSEIRKIRWIYSRLDDVRAGSEFDDEVHLNISKSCDELVEKPDGVALEILKYLFFAVNMSDLTETQQGLENLIRSGHHYNSWPMPGALQL